jgi:acetyl-CoA carboxylase biotin carboxyl carrier protein
MKVASPHLPAAEADADAAAAPESHVSSSASSSASSLATPLGIDDVRRFAQVMREFDLSELLLDRPGGESLRLRRGHGQPVSAHPVPRPAPVHPESPGLLAAKEEKAARETPEEQGLLHITSPFVGTFYRSPGPDTAPFVEAGQRVRKGQTVCIIEAMKLMNELESEVDGVVVACLAENGRPVEYGEPLFRIRPA